MFQFLGAWLITGITDGLFSSCLAAFAYGSTVTRLWQGVAAVLLGAAAMEGGLRTAAIGLLMHFCVALAWTTVFFLILMFVPAVRGIVASPIGLIAVACAYGPIIWTVMSLLLIPQFTHRPPVVNFRWWVQFAGHIPFVALPIVASLSSSKF